MNLKDMGLEIVDLIHLAQDMGQWLAVANPSCMKGG
jgi:hypothetical protein